MSIILVRLEESKYQVHCIARQLQHRKVKVKVSSFPFELFRLRPLACQSEIPDVNRAAALNYDESDPGGTSHPKSTETGPLFPCSMSVRL